MGVSIVYVAALALLKLENDVVLIRLCPKYFFEFGFGMTTAKMYLDYPHKKYAVKQRVLFLVGVCGVAFLGISSMTPTGRLLNDIPAFMSILSLFWWLYRLNIGWVKHIFLLTGYISFEWYLLHILVFTCVFSLSDGSFNRDVVCATIAIPISVCVAVLMKKGIEYVSKSKLLGF